MSFIKEFCPIVIYLFLSVSCSDDVPSYRQLWQDAHHMDDSQMVGRYGEQSEGMDNTFGLILEAVDGNWGKVEAMTSGYRVSEMAAYYHNLAMAMKGCLADSLMYYYQPFERGLFLPVGESSSQLKIAASSEVWYRLGEMTMAEHGAMLAQAFSENHYGTPYLKRLAEINLVNGQDEAAKKYLRLLSKEPGFERWVSDRMPGNQSREVKRHIEKMRMLVPKQDFVHSPVQYRKILKNLLASNPDNELARQYLLCYDIITKDLEGFILDYDPVRDRSRLYDEAVLLFLATHNSVTKENVSHFRLSDDVLQEFTDFSNMLFVSQGTMAQMKEKYGNTYWFFYKYAKRNAK